MKVKVELENNDWQAVMMLVSNGYNAVVERFNTSFMVGQEEAAREMKDVEPTPTEPPKAVPKGGNSGQRPTA
jgi:hypothetical protein